MKKKRKEMTAKDNGQYSTYTITPFFDLFTGYKEEAKHL